MLTANGIILFFCLAPFQLANFLLIVQNHTNYSVLDESQSQTLRWLATCLLLLNLAINPYVYGVANPNYRQAFIKAFCYKQIISMITTPPSVSGQNVKDYIKDSRVQIFTSRDINQKPLHLRRRLSKMYSIGIIREIPMQ